MKTLGWKLTRLEPKHGFSAETDTAVAVVLMSLRGMLASTTHVIASSVVGGTFFQSLRRIRWTEVEKMVIAWVITSPPLAAIIGSIAYLLMDIFL